MEKSYYLRLRNKYKPDKMKNHFRSFLKKHGFLPLRRWNFFKIEHGTKTISKNNIVKIREQVDKKSGIYVYKKGKKVLYVGKAVFLFGRLKSHNRESFESAPKGAKDKAWHKFFSKNDGKLYIYWKEVKLEKDRVIFEKMLEYVLEPKFELFRKKFEGEINK